MDTLVAIHSLLRWIVLLAALAALGVGISSWAGAGGSEKLARQAMLAYAVAFDAQVLLGVVLWLRGNFLQYGDRFIRLEHPAIMLLALAIVHVAAARARRSGAPVDAARLRTIGAAVSLALILVGIPWRR